jgi:hypothetical protein
LDRRHQRQRPTCSVPPLFDTVGHADAAVRCASKQQSIWTTRFERGDAIEMPDIVLRVAIVPAIDARQHRGGGDTQDSAQIGLRQAHQVVIVPREQFRAARSASEAAQQQIIVGGAVAELHR